MSTYLSKSRCDHHKPAFWAVLLLFVGGWIGALCCVHDFGVSWDEGVQAEYAERVGDYYATGGRDQTCNSFLDLKYYGPTVDLAAAAIYQYFPQQKFIIRHLASVLMGLLTLVPLYRFGRLLGKPWLGVWAGIALLLMPRFVGHSFVNSKDIPFACLFAWSMWTLTAFFATDPRKWRHVGSAAVCMGLLAAIRPGGWVLMTAVLIVLYVFAEFVQRRRAATGKSVGAHAAVMLVLAWSTMVALWPWAHAHPFANPVQAMQVASHFHLQIPVLFEGASIVSTDLPRYYLPKYLWMTVPVFLLGLAAVGLVGSVPFILRHRYRHKSCVLFALQIWLVLPLVLYVIKKPNVYDGMRHFLFLLPCVALWAAIGLNSIWERLHSKAWRIVTVFVVASLAALTAADIVRLHPYQIAYFNATVGGLAGAEGRYETEYWLTSYREAIDWIAEQAMPSNRPIRVLVAANEHARTCAGAFCPPSVELHWIDSFGHEGEVPAPYDFYVGTYRMGMSQNFSDSPIVKTIGRDGATFAVVRRSGPVSPSVTSNQ